MRNRIINRDKHVLLFDSYKHIKNKFSSPNDINNS